MKISIPAIQRNHNLPYDVAKAISTALVVDSENTCECSVCFGFGSCEYETTNPQFTRWDTCDVCDGHGRVDVGLAVELELTQDRIDEHKNNNPGCGCRLCTEVSHATDVPF